MFGRPSTKSNKNSIVLSQSSRQAAATKHPAEEAIGSMAKTMEQTIEDEVRTEVVDEIFTHSRDCPIMKSGTASSRNKLVSVGNLK